MMENIEALEKRLWAAADQLRANSGLGSNEYFLPLLGILFLRQASTRFNAVTKEVEDSLPSRGGQKRQAAKDDYTKRRSIYLRKESKYEYLVSLKGEENLGQAINKAMDLIEADYNGLKGVLPRNYEVHSDTLLRSLIGIFNDDVLQKASGDVFGRIYEYFLMKFSMAGAHDSGEFFTPPSIVQMIVNVIEPDHGKVFDPACGSGGMFVQTSHFLEQQHRDATKAVTFYGQEKNETTINIAKMNLAVHGLEGDIKKGNTFHYDQHRMLGKADFVMANPPFNVDGVDSEAIKKDPRLSFGLPGVNKSKTVSNGNYLWISYFYSYLNAKGRAGFVMSSQASSAGHDEAVVRRKLVESGHVDVMVAIRSNFFYTRSVPCELWFFDKGKPKDKLDRVLFLDARNINRKVTRKIFDFSPEQLNNLSAIVWLYRGEVDKFLGLIQNYFGQLKGEYYKIIPQALIFDEGSNKMLTMLEKHYAHLQKNKEIKKESIREFQIILAEFQKIVRDFQSAHKSAVAEVDRLLKLLSKGLPAINAQQHRMSKEIEKGEEQIKGLLKLVEHCAKLGVRAIGQVRTMAEEIDGILDVSDRKELAQLARAFTVSLNNGDDRSLLTDTIEPLQQAVYFYRQIHWLQEKFPDGKLRDVEGLVKLVSHKEIEKNDWSLTPGRYVGVAPLAEDEDFHFEERLGEIHDELDMLNEKAIELAKTIQKNFEELCS